MAMLCGYEDIAKFYVESDYASSGKDLGNRLPPEYYPLDTPPDPWFRGKGGCREDFVLVAEFSELVGPVPLVIFLLFFFLKFKIFETGGPVLDPFPW